MKILYVARHTCGLNDDEGAIGYALEKLGHIVHRIQQDSGYLASQIPDADFCLFHHWEDLNQIGRVEIPKVFWCFDLINYQDNELGSRNKNRIAWITKITDASDLGFCTDGDWVRQDTTGKLIQLLQGADERRMRMPNRVDQDVPLLLTGAGRGGERRQRFVDDMRNIYGESLTHIESGIYQEKLASLIERSEVVLAPDAPATDHYWSNRVYMTLGFGGFLLHPYCEDLTHHYTSGREIVYYKNRQELDQLIDHYQGQPEERWEIQSRAFERTAAEHTYRHRCEVLMEEVQKRIL